MHAGAGTGLVLVQISALIPGLLPTLVLLGAIGFLVLLPVLIAGLAAALLALPPFALWKLVLRTRRSRGPAAPHATQDSVGLIG
jgi:hypothetical protein